MLTEGSLALVRALVRDRAGLDLGPEKGYLVEGRLSALAREFAPPTLDALVAAAGAAPDGDLARQVVEAMLTCETSFFRDPGVFEVLAGAVVPELDRARRGARPLTVWCGACASGQEPYSVAMALHERAPQLGVRIIATDISGRMLERTRAGLYTQFEVNRGLPARHLVRYFVRRGVDWQLRDEVLRMVEVRRLNLIEDLPPAAALDVVLLRNVLIYFGNDLKRAVLGRVHAALRPEGALLLGAAETTLGLHEGFEPHGPARPGWYRPRATEVRDAVPRA